MSFEDDRKPLHVWPQDSKDYIDHKQTLGAKRHARTEDLEFQINRVIKKEDPQSENPQSKGCLEHPKQEEILSDMKVNIKLEDIKQEPTDVKIEIDSLLQDQESTDDTGSSHYMFNTDLVLVREDDPPPVKVESSRRIFKCKECSFRCRRKTTLEGHAQVHMNRSQFKLFKCQECDFQYKRQDAFERHLSFHEGAGARMFRCHECSFKSKRKVNLLYHSLEHQRPTEAETFECVQCGFKTNYESRLKQHKVIHATNVPHVTRFKRNSCNVESKYRRSLEPHIHGDQSSVPTFECTECNYRTERRPQHSLHRLVPKDVSHGKMIKDESRFESEHQWSPIKAELIKTE